MKFKKIGLALGGGGGKGSYQIGVWKALKKHGLDKYVEVVSGTSIGSLNLTLFTLDEYEKAESVWMTLSRKNILKVKNLKSIFSKDKFSLFSREGLRNILDEYVDLKKVSQSNKALYVATTNNDKNRGEFFMLNNKSEYEIKH